MESQGGAEDPLDRAGRIDEEPCVDAGMQQDDSLADKLEGGANELSPVVAAAYVANVVLEKAETEAERCAAPRNIFLGSADDSWSSVLKRARSTNL